jgi:cytidylate kinase
MSKKIVITIDGPAGSGKSTTAKLLAEKLGYAYLDTGAMYRAITLKVLQEQIAPNDRKSIIAMLPSISLRLSYDRGKQETFLNGADVSDAIRDVNVTQNVSAVSSIQEVRQFLVNQQQEIGKSGGWIVDGRDAGTVIFPQAEVKFFLTATITERAKRRSNELKEKDIVITMEQMIEEIKTRDEFDQTRKESPLQKAVDAIEIDNSTMTISEQVNFMLLNIRQRFPNLV